MALPVSCILYGMVWYDQQAGVDTRDRRDTNREGEQGAGTVVLLVGGVDWVKDRG